MAATRAMQAGRSVVDRTMTPQAAAERQVDALLRVGRALEEAMLAIKDLMAATYTYTEAIEAKGRAG